MNLKVKFFLLGVLAQVLIGTSGLAASKAESASPSATSTSSAASANGKVATASALAQDYEKTKQNLIAKEVQQRQVMSALFNISRKMRKLVSEQANMEQQRMVLETTNHELATRILELEEKSKTQKVLMRERLVAIYKLGGQGVARIIFSSSSSSQLEKNLKILGAIAKRDLDLVKDYTSSMEELEQKRSKLQKRLAHMKKLEQKIHNKEAALMADNDIKSKLLEKIRESQQFTKQKLDGIRSKSAQYKEVEDSGVLDLLFRPAFFEQKGQLPMPVSGTFQNQVAQKFGVFHDEQYNVSWSQKGVVLKATRNTPVHSIFDGRVAYVGAVDGFGKTVVVDHGDHYYSVYSGYNKVDVREGDEVKQNQVLGLSGFHPESGTEGLYLEIRHFSEPYDPQAWLKGKPL